MFSKLIFPKEFNLSNDLTTNEDRPINFYNQEPGAVSNLLASKYKCMLGDLRRLANKKTYAIHLLKDKPKEIQDTICDLMNLVNGSETAFKTLLESYNKRKDPDDDESDWGDLGEQAGSEGDEWGSLCDEVPSLVTPKKIKSDPANPDPIVEKEFVEACQSELDAMTPLPKGKPMECESSDKPSRKKILFHTGTLKREACSGPLTKIEESKNDVKEPSSVIKEEARDHTERSNKEKADPISSLKTEPNREDPITTIKKEPSKDVIYFEHGIKPSAIESKSDLSSNRTILFKTSSSASSAPSEQITLAALQSRASAGPSDPKVGAAKQNIRKVRAHIKAAAKAKREAEKVEKEALKEEKRKQKLAMKAQPKGKATAKKKAKQDAKSQSQITKSGSSILTVRSESSTADPDAWFYERIDSLSINYAFQGTERAYLMGRTASSGPKPRLICEFLKKRDSLYKEIYQQSY